MIAINIYSKLQYKVYKYKDVLYIYLKHIDKYYILKKSYIKLDDIEEGKEFSYYKINNELYTGFYSTEYKCFANTTKIEQMRLDI